MGIESGSYRAWQYDFRVLTTGAASALHQTLEDLRCDEVVRGPDLRVDESSTGFTVRLSNNSSHEYQHDRLHQVVRDVVTHINRATLDAETDRLHIHSGLISKESSGTLIAAHGGTGKTSLVLELCLRGWTYISDEVTSVAPDGEALRSFPKPLSVKPGSVDLLHTELEDRLGRHLPTGLSHQLSASSLGFSVAHETHPALVVHYRTDEGVVQPAWHVLSPADAVVSLAQHTMDLGRAGHAGFVALARLCSRTFHVELTRGDLKGTANLVEQLFSSETRVSASTSVPIEEVRTEFTDTETILIGEEAVLRNPKNGRLASLPAGVAAIWYDMISTNCVGIRTDQEQALIVDLESARLLEREGVRW